MLIPIFDRLSFKRSFLMVAMLLVALSATAQYYYPQPAPYPYGYQYYPQQYPQYQQPYQPYQQPQYPQQQQPAPGQYAPDTRFSSPADIDSSKPIEIWLGKQVGRWGDYWFDALGGKPTHRTPQGKFTVKARHKEFYSRKYKAKMPRSVFFTEQCAIHVGSLKTKSHGCIHVNWEAGELLYDLSTTGKTQVIVHP